ncbi:MAG: PDZ domain-containing protein [Planctomycetes bacterium]|nr:PDZ domain-containing protein [Planctomycetota bacterium]
MKIRNAVFGFWWAANGLLFLGLVAESLYVASTSDGSGLLAGLFPPQPLPSAAFQKARDAGGTELLRDLPNPLNVPKESGSTSSPRRSELSEVALLHGIDQVTGDSNSATAYLFLPSRRIEANAYLGEVIRDSATGQEIPELAGWKLARLIPGGAVFRKGSSEETLRIDTLPSSAVSSAPPFNPAPPSTNASPSPQRPGRPAYLGVSIGFPREGLKGVPLESVQPGSAAHQAGLMPGDVITKVNDISTDTPDQLQQTIANLREGDLVTITGRRNGADLRVRQILGARPE